MKTICIFGYAVSAVLITVLSYKLIDLRTKCIYERSRLTSIISEIQTLRRENEALKNMYFRKINPRSVDKNTNAYHIFNENEVFYLK